MKAKKRSKPKAVKRSKPRAVWMLFYKNTDHWFVASSYAEAKETIKEKHYSTYSIFKYTREVKRRKG